MPNIRYSKDHEWIAVDGNTGTVGITDYAQSQLGDVVFVELPQAGRQVDAGGEIAVVESVKAASEIYAPVGGTITENNSALEADPALVNAAAESGAWFFKMTIANPAELDALMDRAAYDAYLATL
ncbi:glycine cleavage system protein GcvH [Ferrovibrio sp. MS7]|uniref:glycine cleavage system protein GcvH n=1 Tax=Ferrovibrio plantarum TaxID=3119164 RepID=UPI00313702A5